MLISRAWLAEIVPVPPDAEAVARALTARGLTVDAVVPAGDDVVFDIDVPANRPDALGHRGVAREIAAAFGLTLTAPPRAEAGTGRAVDATVAVAVEAPELCGRYTAGLIRGVSVGPSPAWVVARLEVCGLRTIDNVVDVSNLVMLELGQPVHFFDLDAIGGGRIVVRRARAGERITTLDGVPRTLLAEDLVIADASRAIALAGVMGGAATEIRATTRDVLVEAAWFDARSVRGTARSQGLVTDASQRFVRGSDPEAPAMAQALAARLLREIAGGTPAPGPIDVRSTPRVARRLEVRLSRAAALLGFAPSASEAKEALAAVGLEPVDRGGVVEVTIPSWRVDLEREADLVEEIGRHLGYDRVPGRTPPTAPPQALRPPLALEESVRDRMAGLGFHEALNYAMIGPGEDDPFTASGSPEPLALDNPISEALSRLRRALAPGLVRATAANLRYGTEDVRLFEIGRVFFGRGGASLPDERLHAGFAWSGAAHERHWSEAPRPVDAYDAAGIVEAIFSLVEWRDLPKASRCELPGLHPGLGFTWPRPGGRPLAWCGAAHPAILEAWNLPAGVVVGEIDLDELARCHAGAPRYRPVPRLPAVTRDFSIVLDPGVGAGDVVARLAEVAAPADRRFAWVDRYEGPPLGDGQVAMTLRVILQPLERTLTDGETESYRKRMIETLERVDGARLRRIDT